MSYFRIIETIENDITAQHYPSQIGDKEFFIKDKVMRIFLLWVLQQFVH